MLHINTQNPSSTTSTTLFAFKPRQVLLAEHNRNGRMTAKEEDGSKIPSSLTPEMKETLHKSILRYLYRNGFSKTLKRFQSEAQIEDDTWKTSSLHLEDIYCKYVDACRNSDANLKTSKKPELGDDGTAKREDSGITKKDNALEETTTKKKKKKKGNVESDSAIEDQSKSNCKKLAESGKSSGEISHDTILTESETKTKKKKKKNELESPCQTEEAKSDVLKKPVDGDKMTGLEINDSTKKSKDKKKKSTHQDELQPSTKTSEDEDKVKKPVDDEMNGLEVHDSTKKRKDKKKKNSEESAGQTEEAKSDVVKKPVDEKMNGLEVDDSTKKHKDKKKRNSEQEKLLPSLEGSERKEKLELRIAKTETEVKHKEKKKKKKTSTDSAVGEDQVNPVRTESENDGVQPDSTKKEKESSKKRKRLSSYEKENQSPELKTIEDSKRQKTESKEAKEVNESKAQKSLLDGRANGNLEIKGEEKSGSQKSMGKQHNSSAEPKTVNAFQRVKIDQVEFAHEKLQDNSYWAKDGAEIGYGAKAQEVLGQVRGRDFRHEKTKKKRGSYRGGQIDLQSHSIKFDYSDEE